MNPLFAIPTKLKITLTPFYLNILIVGLDSMIV